MNFVLHISPFDQQISVTGESVAEKRDLLVGKLNPFDYLLKLKGVGHAEIFGTRIRAVTHPGDGW